jgi:hypothetical protein
MPKYHPQGITGLGNVQAGVMMRANSTASAAGAFLGVLNSNPNQLQFIGRTAAGGMAPTATISSQIVSVSLPYWVMLAWANQTILRMGVT